MTVRRRKLINEYVHWLVVGLALFRNEPIIEISRGMNISLDGEGQQRHWVFQRWQIELGFRDIKSSMQNAITLRSKSVELVYQEPWGLLLAYNLVRREARLAVDVSHGYRPDEVSFKFACQYISAELMNMALTISPANNSKRLKNLRGNVAILIIKNAPSH